MRKVVLALVALPIALGAVPPMALACDRIPAAPPPSIPSIQQWAPGGPAFTLGSAPRVAYADPAVAPAAIRLAADLSATTGRGVVAANGQPRTGDVAVGIDGGGPDEGYRIAVGDTLTIDGNDRPGAFYGTQTVLQWLTQTRTVAGGIATDWPGYRERGMLIDAGRKYFSMQWVREQIRRVAYFKGNTFQLHLSDAFGFRLESASHPEIVSPEHYSKEQIREIVADAASFGIEVIPEIEFPGHMQAILAAHPDLRLTGADGTTTDGSIDLSNPKSYDLMRDLLDEFVPLFPGRYWHIGGDEYVQDYDRYPQLADYANAHYGPQALPKDTFHGFLNWANEIVRAHGKQGRIWNDGLIPGGSTIAVDRDLVVDHWSVGTIPPFWGPAYRAGSLIDLGFEVSNASYTPTYSSLGLPAAINEPPALAFIRGWDPAVFVDGSRLSPAQHARNRGAKVFVWCDEPDVQSEKQIGVGITERLRFLAQATWGSPRPPTYPEFLAAGNAVGEPPHGGPG